MALSTADLPAMRCLLYRFLGGLRNRATEQAASTGWQGEWADQSY